MLCSRSLLYSVGRRRSTSSANAGAAFTAAGNTGFQWRTPVRLKESEPWRLKSRTAENKRNGRVENELEGDVKACVSVGLRGQCHGFNAWMLKKNPYGLQLKASITQPIIRNHRHRQPIDDSNQEIIHVERQLQYKMSRILNWWSTVTITACFGTNHKCLSLKVFSYRL